MEPFKEVPADAICCECEKPMKRSIMNPHRFSFRALFTQYECASEPQCLVGDHKEKINRILCNICGELSKCYDGWNYIDFCAHHSGHAYIKLHDTIKEMMCEPPFVVGQYHIEYYEKSRADLKELAEINQNNGLLHSDRHLWHKCPSNLRCIRIDSIHTFRGLFDIIRYEYGARMLTYKKTKKDPILCIICNAEYVNDAPPEIIFDHFTNCAKAHKDEISNGYIFHGCNSNTRYCVGKIKCKFCESRENKYVPSVLELIERLSKKGMRIKVDGIRQ